MSDEQQAPEQKRPSAVMAIPDKLKSVFDAHIALYQSDPEKAHWWDASVVNAGGIVPTLMLTTIGRKSGEPRTITLQYFKKDGKVLLGATKGGTPNNPIWFENLVVTPECDVRIGAFKGKAIARIAEGAEREELWAHVSSVQTKYQLYQKRTDRQIPVVVLDFFESEGEMPDLANPPA